MKVEFFTSHYGFVVDYLAEALRELRKHTFTEVLDRHFSLGSHLKSRDVKAVRKTVAGLAKLIHPGVPISRDDLREMLELALEGRRFRDQGDIGVPPQGAPLRARRLELIHRDAHRDAGTAVRALRPVDVIATAAEAVLGQQRVSRDVRPPARVDENRDGIAARQITALVRRGDKKSE